MADLLVSTGLRDVGYNYVVVDEGWQELTRDTDGRQQFNKTKLPDGIKALADYVHKKKMKFGIYSDAGFVFRSTNSYCEMLTRIPGFTIAGSIQALGAMKS